ncbi:MAG: EAL domain-containing protein, partial [Lachnospiraceae bacterium]|nr:EAL domain-containing protein [Lachnospiraceae bacterium]
NRYLLDESIAIMAQRKLAGQACVPLVRKLSSKGFLDQEFRKHGLELIDSVGLPRSILSFGLSESAFSTENRALNHEVRTMRQQGFRVWLDDFGAGNMAMNGLLEPEFDAMRINLSTLKHYQEAGRYQEILTTMLSLGRTLHLTSVASGTSGSEEETMLAMEGCQKLQKTSTEAAFPADQLEERLNAGFLPPLEDVSLRAYYDTIGSVRLSVSPSQMAPAPSAIFEEIDGNCRCLRWNQEFLDLLEVFDIHEISELNRILNHEPYHSLVEKQMEEARMDQRWHAVRFADQVSMNGACRFAACNDSDHRTAVLTVFFGSLQNSIGIPEP